MNRSLFAASRPGLAGYHDVSPAELLAHPAVRIIDVREPHELDGELGHIPGAELVPLATLPQAAAGWDRDAEILVVCRSGGRSARAAGMLHQLGFRRVMNLVGGMTAYRQLQPLPGRGG